MTNEISSMAMAQLPSPARKSGQLVRLETANRSTTEGQSLPQQGKALPPQGNTRDSRTDINSLKNAVDSINQIVQNTKRDITFSLDESSGKTVIEVVDSESNELIRQIPSEEVLALSNYLQSEQSSTPEPEKIPSGILFSGTT